MFRFTIRELILLTVIVAMGTAWWVDRQAMSRDRAALQEERAALTKEKFAIRAKLGAMDAEFIRVMKDLVSRQSGGNTRRARTITEPTEPLPRLIEPLYYPPDPNSL